MNHRLSPQSTYDWKTLFRRVVGLSVAVIAAALFFELAGDVWLKEGFAWDVPIMVSVHRLSHPWLDRLMLCITQTGAAGIGVVLLAAFSFLWRRRHKLAALTMVLSVVGAAAMNAGLKLLFARPRPIVFPPITSETSYSFPSGHTLTSAAFYGLLAVFLWRWGRRGWALFSALWVLLVGFSRIYLGVHYPSDVLASLALGSLWLFAMASAYDWGIGHRLMHSDAN
ncbi:MAG: phosphatase PAP2 family protein [Anaerolineae bacterium]